MKRLVLLLAVFFVWKFLINGLNYLYVDGEAQAWQRILWHNFYAQEENIDYLYLGSSHVYCDLNPFLLDELNGENNFNLSTSSQRLNGSYYLLKEADKEHKLKHVYVELYYELATGEQSRFLTTSAGRTQNWRNTDYMQPSFNRLEYMATMSAPEHYIEALFPFIRYREKYFELNYIRSQIEYKHSEEYRNFVKCTKDEQNVVVYEFRDKGYNYSTTELLASSLKEEIDVQGNRNLLKENPMTEEAELYLRKILEYCNKSDIQVTLFSSPVTDLRILSAETCGSYDNYVNQVKDIASEYDVEYYDFNLCKEEYLPLKELKYFRDKHHLNADGAEVFTKFFYKVMQGTKEENALYFYESYAEKCRETDGQIYGILRMNNAGENMENQVLYKVISNWKEGMEYRILLTPSEGETVGVQDFSENTEFEVPAEEHGICTIVARELGETDKVQTLEIEY